MHDLRKSSMISPFTICYVFIILTMFTIHLLLLHSPLLISVFSYFYFYHLLPSGHRFPVSVPVSHPTFPFPVLLTSPRIVSISVVTIIIINLNLLRLTIHIFVPIALPVRVPIFLLIRIHQHSASGSQTVVWVVSLCLLAWFF